MCGEVHNNGGESDAAVCRLVGYRLESDGVHPTSCKAALGRRSSSNVVLLLFLSYTCNSTRRILTPSRTWNCGCGGSM